MGDYSAWRYMFTLRVSFLACTLLAAPMLRPAAADDAVETPVGTADEQKFFREEISPILRNKCFGCHGEGKTLEGKFDMRTRAGLLKGGEMGAAVVVGKPDESSLYLAVLREDKKFRMPPKDDNALSPVEVNALRKWIEIGVPWSSEPAATVTKWDVVDGDGVLTSGGLDPSWTTRKYRHEDLWAYFPVKAVEVPQAADGAPNTGNEIDAFINQKLYEKKLTPAPPADPITWLRRVTFDLTGLPPTPKEMADFEKRVAELQKKTRNPQSAIDGIRIPQSAIEEVVDRLLASPAYGERMAQHWLDVVRYADSGGFSADWERPHAWRYRDYVIRSFNADKPYDRFVIEQLAGDELRPNDPEMAIAVGFIRMGPFEHTSMSVPEVTRQQFLDDVTNGVGVTFMAQGMSCCKCHDHKFDPLPTRDYYRLQSVFASTKLAELNTPFLAGERTEDFERLREEIAAVANAQDWLKTEQPDSYTLFHVKDKRTKYMNLARERCEPLSFTVRSGGGQRLRILQGGSLESPGDAVTPGVLSAVRLTSAEPNPKDWNVTMSVSGRRLEFAKWLADPRHPMTARVIANRVWQMHFGRGLVATANNFGRMGARPTHPELLDWMATKLIARGWSLKSLHRLICTSEAYQRGGLHPDRANIDLIDSQNAYLSYFPPRRLTAEEIRDAMLAASGELNRDVGGPATYPEINWEVALQPRHIVGTVAPAYQPSPVKSDRDKRTIYTFRCRTLNNPLLEVLNQPSSEISCERRDETTVTPQVFSLLNSESVHARALAMAARLVKEERDGDQRIRTAFRTVLGRWPSDDEVAACRQHVATMTEHHRQHVPTKTELPKVVNRETIDQHTGAPVRWEEKLHWMQKYQRDLMPWDATPEVRGLAELCLVLLNSNEFVYVY